MKWEKTFELSGPVAEVWESFTNGRSEHRVWDPDNAYLSGGAVRVDWGEVRANSVLSWKELQGESLLAEMTVVFEEVDTGTRITITSEGFAIPPFMHQARMRGWAEMLWDLELYFRTGRMLDRLHSRGWGKLGLAATGDGFGLTVAGVTPDSPAAQAGLSSGDVVVRAAGAPVYEVGDLWTLESVLPDGSDVEFEYFRGAEQLTGRGTIAASRS